MFRELQLCMLKSSHYALQAENQALQAENPRLRQEMQQLQNSYGALLAENQRLHQEKQEQRIDQRAEVPKETTPQVPFPQLTRAQEALLIMLPKDSCLSINNQQQVPHPGWKIEFCHPFMILILSVLVFLMGFYIAS